MAFSNFEAYFRVQQPNFLAVCLCLIVFTCFLKEENDVGEFFLTLEKDPQQEDFLQGRMQGNPYRSVLIS